ncbi:type II toxin-antitoxin system YafQ family toxin [Acinetobacter terrae]
MNSLKNFHPCSFCRDCHVKPDLVLIYRLVGEDVLELHQLDSYSEIFG